jgi:hypothetical protein
LNLNQYTVLITIIRLVFLEVVTQSWLRKEPTLELGPSRIPLQNVDVNVDEDEEEEEWHLDVEEDDIQDAIDINMNEIEDAIDIEEIVKE